MAPMTNLKEYADEDDLQWLHPPKNVHDAGQWNVYWINQISRNSWLFFSDMFINELWLARTMINFGFQTVLCAGNGISLEPHALAYAGFEVTAVDLSVEATKFVSNLRPGSKDLRHFFCGPMGRPVRQRGEALGFFVRYLRLLIGHLRDQVLARRIRRDGGKVEFLAEDLLDPEVCPGPFDVVIERRTVQLFAESERDGILDRLTSRLQRNGIFLSHCHMGWWRPGMPREHLAESWFREHGFTVSYEGSEDVSRLKHDSGRIALLSVSSG